MNPFILLIVIAFIAGLAAAFNEGKGWSGLGIICLALALLLLHGDIRF